VILMHNWMLLLARMKPDNEPQRIEGHAFFDPKTPETPVEILGIPTDPLMDLGKALGSIAYLSHDNIPYSIKRIGYRAGDVAQHHSLSLFPLLERLQAGEDVQPIDVRPYRKPIKKIIPKLRSADWWSKVAGGVGVGIPIRRIINRKVEEEFIERVPPLLDQAGEYLPQAEPYVAFLEQFDNPREQFVSEIVIVAEAIRFTARKEAQKRRQPDKVTAEDAAVGIRQTINRILANDDETKKRLPMFSHLVVDQLPPKTQFPPTDKIGIVAPEIMNMLESALPADQRDDKFYDSILRYAHPQRWIATKVISTDFMFMKDLDLILPSIRDLLPTSGVETRNTYNRVRDFLKPKPKKN